MRFLHTGDWHVGKGIQGRSRADEHTAVLAEIAGIARDQEVDLVLVAGDMFDTMSPSPEAECIVYAALLEMSAAAHVVVIPGNHDNERRLAAIGPLLELTNVTVGAFLTDESVRMLDTPSGDPVRIAMLPWLSHRYVIKADQLMGKDASELSADFKLRMRRIVDTLTAGFGDDAVNIVLGHVTIAGGELGGGERTAQTIFEYWVDPTIFPSFAHYVALGHLHKPQQMAGACPIYYCGSPLQLDFSDTTGDKSVRIVEAFPGRPASVTELPLAAGRRLRTLTGTMDQLAPLAGTTGDDYLRVRVREPARVGLGDDVRDLFPNTVKVIVEHETEPASGGETRVGMDPRELFAEYLASKSISDDDLLSLFDELHDRAHETAAS